MNKTKKKEYLHVHCQKLANIVIETTLVKHGYPVKLAKAFRKSLGKKKKIRLVMSKVPCLIIATAERYRATLEHKK